VGRTQPDPTRQVTRLLLGQSEDWPLADFATGDKGGDPISLAAYVFGTSQVDAARTLAAALGVEVQQ
jgi:hypothetical protein